MPGETATIHATEIEQLEAIKANDARALKVLYHENYYKVESYCLKNTGSAEQAKDIFQEAFYCGVEKYQDGKILSHKKFSTSRLFIPDRKKQMG